MERLTSFNAVLEYQGEVIATATFDASGNTELGTESDAFDKDEAKVKKQATKWANEQIAAQDISFMSKWKNWDLWESGKLVRRRGYGMLVLTITANWTGDSEPEPTGEETDEYANHDRETGLTAISGLCTHKAQIGGFYTIQVNDQQYNLLLNVPEDDPRMIPPSFYPDRNEKVLIHAENIKADPDDPNAFTGYAEICYTPRTSHFERIRDYWKNPQ